MKKIKVNTIIIPIILIGIIISYNPYLNAFDKSDKTLDCSKFKNGTFKILNPALKGYTIKRNGNIQIESYKENEQVYKIEWIKDCTYTLTPTEETLKKTPNFPKTGVLTIKIIQVKPNSYIQTTSSNFSSQVQTSEIIKIK
ncbi:MAG: hypothetical protein JST20_02400 [Bacteroidetes bacterium]|nr:hypothetical protein [Bacteroidota bacterium]